MPSRRAHHPPTAALVGRATIEPRAKATVRAAPHGRGRAPALVLAGGAALGLLVWRTVRRVEVTGTSMAPALLPGDRLVVLGTPWSPQPWPRPGAVVAVRDPRLPSRILVKRVTGVDRPAGTLAVTGDAAEASTDSREFGPVARSSVVGRALYRYAPANRSGPVPGPEEYHQA